MRAAWIAVDEFLARSLGESLELEDLILLETKQIRPVFHESFVDELLDDFLAQALDVERVDHREMANSLFDLGDATARVRAAHDRLARNALDRRIADGAAVTEDEISFLSRFAHR